jgi:hypothetical protein
MLEKPAAQEPRRGEHRRSDPNNDDQLDEINVIFGCSMSIASKKNEVVDTDISFAPEDHLETELSNRNLPFVVKLLIG